MIINIRPRISSPFGSVDSVHTSPHTGVDVAVPEGTELHAVADGIISKVVDGGSLGNGVFLHMPDGRDVIYGHLSRVTVRPGDRLHAGDSIGLSGNTGHSTGPHLHLGLMQDGHYVNPSQLVDAAISGTTKKAAAHTGPLGGLRDALDSFNSTMQAIGDFFKSVGHWLNPVTWWNAIDHLFSVGVLDTPLMVGTIIGIILLMGGAKWPKKWIIWGWALYWVFRGMVFG